MIQAQSVNPLLFEVGEDVMGFLNEIQFNYPAAISLASGRPDESFFDFQSFKYHFEVYVDSLVGIEKQRAETVNQLGQYGRAKGAINDHIARFLKNDEEIDVSANDILTTVGTQEAISIAVTTLCNKDEDIILVENPTYVGIAHFSIINGYRIHPVPMTKDGISIDALEEKLIYFKNLGKKVKLVYVIPDYQNPTGYTTPLSKRHDLLALAVKYDFLILEDNAYGEFNFTGTKNLPLKALDKSKRVIYLRSFSKTLYPSLRIGILVADQIVNHNNKEIALSNLLALTKGYLTVNTPILPQAILAGILINNSYSLKSFNAAKVLNMKKKRDVMLAALAENFNFPWAANIKWNVPQGGFFISIDVPFAVNTHEVETCASDFGVIFTPMSFFYFQHGGEYQVRLAYSNLNEHQIETAINRFAAYVKGKITNKNFDHGK